MKGNNAVVGVFNSHIEAEKCIRELHRAGFDMKKLSLVGKEYHNGEQVVGLLNVDDRMKVWGKLGAFWGGFWGLLFGSAMFVIPGIGPLIVFGPLVGWIVSALEGALVVGGFGAMAASLLSIGIPGDSTVQYEMALKADKFLVIAHGNDVEVGKAKNILEITGATQTDVHTGING